MEIKRFTTTAKGRSRAVSFDKLVWTVANAKDLSAGFAEQVGEMFAIAAATLEEAGSSKRNMLSVQVILSDINDRDEFDRLWNEWLGKDPAHWPQRACIGAALAPGLLVEMITTAHKEH